MRAALLILICLVTHVCYGANPSYAVFRGSGGIAITTNPPTGLIVIDGSGVFTSSGTNATLSTSTNGVLVAVNSTNINFVQGSNIVISATNSASKTHVGIKLADNITIPGWALFASRVTNAGGINVQGAAEFNDEAVFNADVFLNGTPGSGNHVAIAGDNTLVRTNLTNEIIAVTEGYFLIQMVYIPTLVVSNFSATNIFAPAPISSVTHNSNGVLRGNANFIFTNGQAVLGGAIPGAGVALHVANTGAMGSAQIRLDTLPADQHWDLALDANPETYYLGVRQGTTYAMVWELGGNVGIGMTNPTTRFDLQGRATLRSNVFLPNISSNATPIALLATDAAGEVFETAIPTVGASAETNAVLTNIIGTVARNVTNVVSLSTTNATSKPLTNSYANGVLTLPGIEAGANVTITANGSNWVIAASASGGTTVTNEALTNLVGTVARNVTNVVSLSTTNATSKPLTNSYANGVLTLPGIQAGTNVIIFANGSNWVINAQPTAGNFFVSGNSNQIPFLDTNGNWLTFLVGPQKISPGFGYNPGANSGLGALLIGVDNGEDVGLVQISKANASSSPVIFTPALSISNIYAYSGSGNKVTQEMVRVTFVDQSDGSDPESFIQTWRHADAGNPVELSMGIRRDGLLSVRHGVMYKSNLLASTFPTAAMLGVGGHWIGISNGAVSTLVDIYSLDGSSTAMKVLAP